jgi:hypothetical protein
VITSLWIENFKISNAIHKTGVVNEQRNPSRDPDRLIRWYVGVVVVGVVVNIISGFVLQQKWAWLPPAIFVAALLVTVPRSGLLRRERQGSTRWARGLAFIALAAYLAVAVWGSLTEWPTAVMILSVAFLWGAGIVLMWSTLRSQIQLGLVANGTSTLLLGSGVMLWGVAVRLEGSRMAGTILLIFGIAYLLSSVAVLLHRLALMEVGNLLHGTADYLAGGFFLGEGSLLLGEGSVFVGYGFVLLGVGELMSGIVGLLFVFESKVHRPVFESKVCPGCRRDLARAQLHRASTFTHTHATPPHRVESCGDLVASSLIRRVRMLRFALGLAPTSWEQPNPKGSSPQQEVG